MQGKIQNAIKVGKQFFFHIVKEFLHEKKNKYTKDTDQIEK